MKDLIRHVVDQHGQPITKLHGLRMLNLDFHKTSSGCVVLTARNIGIDKAWSGAYSPASKETRATLLVERIGYITAQDRLSTAKAGTDSICNYNWPFRRKHDSTITEQRAPGGDPQTRR
jgi:hypothetical protein